MQIKLVAVGRRMPTWVEQGFQNYQKRLPRENSLHLVEVPVGRQRDPRQNIKREGESLLAQVDDKDYLVALDESGDSWASRDLVQQLERWRAMGRDVVLLIGGANGLSRACRDRADVCWSLSALTLPHALVRVLVVEQIYRAWSMLSGHPYHRE